MVDMRQLRQMIGLVANPGPVFRAAMEKPRASLVFWLLLATTGAAAVFAGSRLDRPAMERMVVREAGGDKEISENDLAEQTQRAINVRMIGMVGKAWAAALALWLILGLFFWLQLPRASYGLGFFGSLRIAVLCTVPLVLRALLSLPAIASHASIDPERAGMVFRTSLGWLMNPPVPMLAFVDPFGWWCAGLLVVAGRAAGWGRVHTAISGLLAALLLGFGAGMVG